MGYIQHDALIVVLDRDHPRCAEVEQRLTKWRAEIEVDDENYGSEAFRALIVGPVPAVANNYVTWAFLPDGSKEGWEPSDEGDRLRDEFKAIVEGCGEGVHVRFGEDHRSEAGDSLVPWQEEDED